MTACVIDASVVLAFLDEEEGADAALSAVNLAEVIGRLIKGGLPAEEVEGVLAPFPFAVISFDKADARAAGLLRAVTEPVRRALPSPRRTLSHGDHACLALAARLKLPAVTADREWARYAEAVGVEVKLIRSGRARGRAAPARAVRA